MTNEEWLEHLAHNDIPGLRAWFKAEHVENQERALDGDTEPQSADSRERLEADAFAYLQTAYITYPQIIKLLDRQAAITAEETSDAWEEYRDATQREIAELQAQVYELTVDCDMLENERDNLEADLMRANNERERYREKFGKCIDYADAIYALMDDEGLALSSTRPIGSATRRTRSSARLATGAQACAS